MHSLMTTPHAYTPLPPSFPHTAMSWEPRGPHKNIVRGEGGAAYQHDYRSLTLYRVPREEESARGRTPGA